MNPCSEDSSEPYVQLALVVKEISIEMGQCLGFDWNHHLLACIWVE